MPSRGRHGGAAKAICLLLVNAQPTFSLRCVTFNIHAWRDAAHCDNFDKLVALLCTLQPIDVLCLNEVIDPFTAPPADDPYWETVRQRRGYGSALPPAAVPSDPSLSYLSLLSSALALPYVAFGAATTSRSFFGVSPYGNAILSRHQLKSVRNVVARSTEADLSLGGQERTAQDLEDRSCLVATVEADGQPKLGVVCTHLDHKAEELREKQIARFLAEACEAFGSAVPFVLCGDLNSFDERDMDAEGWQAICDLYASRGWPPPPRRSLVRNALEASGLRDTFGLQSRPSAGAGSGSSGGRGPQQPPATSWTETRIDYVMAHDAEAHTIRVRSHQTVSSDASDHLPVVVELEVMARRS